MSKKNPYAIEILEVTQDILDCLLEARDKPLTPSEISRKLGINRSRVFRVLKSLEDRGYVNAGSNGYILGFKFFEIFDKLRWEFDIFNIAKSVMIELAQTTGDMAHLYARTGYHAVCYAHASGNNHLQIEKAIGERIPMNVAAAPLVLLAYTPEKEQENIIKSLDMVAYTQNTITDRKVLRQRLEQIRQEGYAIDNEEFEIGAYSVSAPIIYQHLGIIDAISVDIPSIRFNNERKKQIISLVVDAAKKISEKASYTSAPRT